MRWRGLSVDRPVTGTVTLTVTENSENDRPTKIKRIRETIEVSESHTLVVSEDQRGTIRVSHTSFEGNSIEADAEDDGSVTAQVEGTPPQGEELTLNACRVLVRTLNGEGAEWSEPQEGEEGSHSDCVACSKTDPDRELHIQVVQAIIEEGLWESWGKRGRYDQTSTSPAAVSEKLTQAIEKKVGRIPGDARGNVVLALNALRTPGASLEPVVEEFRSQYAGEVRALGFRQVWLVGLNDSLVWRLDAQD